MATNIRSNFADFFGTTRLPMLEMVILAKTDSYTSMIPVIFNEEAMQTDIYQTTTHSGLRNPVVKPENAPVQFQTMQPGFSKTYTATTFATGYRISKEMVDDGKFSFIQRATESFAKGMFEISEIKAANVFDNAFSVAGPDGQNLCSASHPLENGGGALGVNIGTVPATLSITSFRDLRNIMQSTLNENGQLVKYVPATLVVPQSLQDVAMEITKSQYRPDNANNAINTIYESVKLLPGNFWNYLVSQTAYFLLADKPDHHLMFLDRQPMEVISDYDNHAFAHEIIASRRFDVGFSSWRGVSGNAGA